MFLFLNTYNILIKKNLKKKIIKRLQENIEIF